MAFVNYFNHICTHPNLINFLFVVYYRATVNRRASTAKLNPIHSRMSIITARASWIIHSNARMKQL